MRVHQTIASVGEPVAGTTLSERLANDLTIVATFAALGVMLWLAPPYPMAIAVGGVSGVAAFVVLRLWKPVLALTVCMSLLTLGTLHTFLGGDLRAIPILAAAGVAVAILYHNADLFLDAAERKTRVDINRDGVIGIARNDDELDERRDRALRYVFAFTDRNGDTFKRRIARENLTLMRYLSQREWREWVRDLERAGVVRCPNAQVTEPLVTGYEAACALLERMKEVVLEPDPNTPHRMVRQ